MLQPLPPPSRASRSQRSHILEKNFINRTIATVDHLEGSETLSQVPANYSLAGGAVHRCFQHPGPQSQVFLASKAWQQHPLSPHCTAQTPDRQGAAGVHVGLASSWKISERKRKKTELNPRHVLSPADTPPSRHHSHHTVLNDGTIKRARVREGERLENSRAQTPSLSSSCSVLPSRPRGPEKGWHRHCDQLS